MSGPRRLIVIGLLALVCLPLSGADGATSLVATRVAVPARGVYLGAYVAAPSWAAAAGSVSAFEASIGRRLSIDNHFYGWSEAFPTALELTDRALGRIPMVTWKSPTLAGILSGSQDTRIAARADAVRDFGTPLFIRWGWEMNGYWTEWSGVRNSSAGRHDGPAKYVLAWRRIHDIFEREGATNVSWVWAPNGKSIPDVAWNRISAYYPGDGYVDWVGLSAYNWGTMKKSSRWESFAAIVGRVYEIYSARKPIMVAETASAAVGGDKARWITAVGPALRVRYPNIKALLWFEHPPDWSIRSPVNVLAAFRSLASADVFVPAP